MRQPRSCLETAALRARAAALAGALVVAATPARADDLSAAAPPVPNVPAPSLPRDYDSPDPYRDTVTYLRAAANVLFVDYLTYQYDFIANKEKIYAVTGSDLARNLVNGLPFDTDNLSSNFLGHPYAGAMLFNAARSTGLSFWESIPYTVAGSVTWEFFSESQAPAINDLVVTSFEGIGLGEMLYRASSLALDDSKSGFARFTRETLGLAISPPRGVDRLFSGHAWSDGPPPVVKPAVVKALGGVDEVSAGTAKEPGRHGPSVLAALSVEYGNLLPSVWRTTIPVYDFFDLYAAMLFSSSFGANLQFQTLGLLHGWSSDVSMNEGDYRDNNVLGVVQSLDYQATNVVTFAGSGLGFGDFLVLRDGPRKRLRLSMDLEWSPLVAIENGVNPYAGTDTPRQYNFSTGPSVGLAARWDLGRVGQLGLWARNYGTVVVDGIPGREALGYARLWYDVEVVRDLFGVGLATYGIYRAGSYSGGRTDQATQLSLQVYATVRL